MSAPREVHRPMCGAWLAAWIVVASSLPSLSRGQAEPVLARVQPTLAESGAPITIELERAADVTRVLIGGEEVEVIDRSARRLRVRLGDRDGPLTLVFADGRSDEVEDVRVLRPPTIDRLTPMVLDPGHPLTIEGHGWEPGPTEIVVQGLYAHRFEAGVAVPIRIAVPSDAAPTRVVITTPAGRVERALRRAPPFEIEAFERWEPLYRVGDLVEVGVVGSTTDAVLASTGSTDQASVIPFRRRGRRIQFTVPDGADRGGLVLTSRDGRRRAIPIRLGPSMAGTATELRAREQCSSPGCPVLVCDPREALPLDGIRIRRGARPVRVLRSARDCVQVDLPWTAVYDRDRPLTADIAGTVFAVAPP